MPRFKPYNYDQHSMVVINFQEQLRPGTFEHAIHYLIEHKLDLSVFYPIYQNGTVITADTGFASEANMQYLHERGINGYIPDNRFRRRDPAFAHQHAKYGHRHPRIKRNASRPASSTSIQSN